MKKNDLCFWVIDLPRLALGVFIVLNIITILSYPGGTYIDHTTVGYSFTRNFLSDLGRTFSFQRKLIFYLLNFLICRLF